MRKNVSIAVVIVLLLSLTGCGSGKKKEQIVVYLSLLPSEEKVYKELIKRFEYVTGTEITLVSQQYNQIKQAIISEVSAGRGVVDVFETDVYYLKDLSDYTYDLKEIEDYLNDQNLYKSAYKEGRIAGKLCFIPHRLSCQALIYNSKYIENAPATWADFLDTVDRFSKKTGLKASLYEGLVCDIFPIVWSMQGDIFDLEEENTKEALQIIKRFSGKIHPGSKVFKENSILESQAREEIYMHFNWPFSVNYLKDKGLFPEPNKIAPLPKGKVNASVLGGGYLAVSKVAPHKKKALDFLKFIEAKGSQEFLVKKLGWMPVRDDIWSLFDKGSGEHYSAFIESLNYARGRPAFENYDSVSQIWQRIFHALVFEGKSIEEVTQKHNKKLNSLKPRQ